MPLAHTAFRPQPEVELLGASPISIEDAARGLEVAIAEDEGKVHHVPGSALVNFRQIPRILESIKNDWVGLAAAERPSCFVEVHGRLETHMHPCYLGEKLDAGLRGAAGGLLLKFSRQLDCVPLGFTRLEPAGSHAALVGESPYVHFLADFWAVGFVPKEFQWLVGRFNDVQTARGVNLTILNSFTIFAPKWSLPSQLWFDSAAGKWADDVHGPQLAEEWGAVWVQLKGKIVETSGSQPLRGDGRVHGPLRGGDPYQEPSASASRSTSAPAADANPGKKKGKRKAQDEGGAEPQPAADDAAAAKAAKKAKKKAAAEAAAAAEAQAEEAAALRKTERVKEKKAGKALVKEEQVTGKVLVKEEQVREPEPVVQTFEKKKKDKKMKSEAEQESTPPKAKVKKEKAER